LYHIFKNLPEISHAFSTDYARVVSSSICLNEILHQHLDGDQGEDDFEDDFEVFL
jgi:hypothetical protein